MMHISAASHSSHETCSICLSDFTSPEPQCAPRALTCHPTHKFHLECIGQWMLKKRQCPLCKASIDLNTQQIILSGICLLCSDTFEVNNLPKALLPSLPCSFCQYSPALHIECAGLWASQSGSCLNPDCKRPISPAAKMIIFAAANKTPSCLEQIRPFFQRPAVHRAMQIGAAAGIVAFPTLMLGKGISFSASLVASTMIGGVTGYLTNTCSRYNHFFNQIAGYSEDSQLLANIRDEIRRRRDVKRKRSLKRPSQTV